MKSTLRSTLIAALLLASLGASGCVFHGHGHYPRHRHGHHGHIARSQVHVHVPPPPVHCR
jgi:hypothetical protein